MGRTIGIDLGYQHVVIATTNEKAIPKVLDSSTGRPQIPCMVGLKKSKKLKDGYEILVGDASYNHWEMSPRDTIVFIKRLMGRGVADKEVQEIKKRVMYDIVQPSDGTKDGVCVVMGEEEYSPVDISAMILKKAKLDAEMCLDEEVTHAVITVPAYFNQVQKAATRQAGLKAGLIVTKILDEPTAAAVCYGIDFPESEDPKYILVYALGNNTFDISVLMWAGNIFQPLNLQGDMWLGGDDFEQAIVKLIIDRIQEECGVNPMESERLIVTLKKQARRVREQLCYSYTADIILLGIQDQDGDYIDVSMEVTRKEFENSVQPLVNKVLKLTEEALKNAELSREDIHCVIMAGNSLKIPLVRQSIENMFGKEKIKYKENPKHCVAMGAAIVAAQIGKEIICQAPDPENPKRECGIWNKPEATVCNFCGQPLRLAFPLEDQEDGIILGYDCCIAWFHFGTQAEYDEFNVFVQKNDPYPTENPKTQTFYTCRPDQRMIRIPIYGGDNLEKASANEKQGEILVLLPSGLPIGIPIHITLWLDTDGIFDMKEGHLDDGTDLPRLLIYGDERAIEVLQQAEGAFQAIAVSSIEEVERFKSARERIFVKLKEKDFLGVIEDVERLLSKYNKKLPNKYNVT